MVLLESLPGMSTHHLLPSASHKTLVKMQETAVGDFKLPPCGIEIAMLLYVRIRRLRVVRWFSQSSYNDLKSQHKDINTFK